MENASTVVNKATRNKNAEDAKEMKLMALTNQTPYNLPNGKMKISQNITQNWYARFAGILATQPGTAEKVPKQTSTPYRQLLYQRTDEQENKERRRELKQQQRPMNQMEIQDNDEDPSSEGEQDFQ